MPWQTSRSLHRTLGPGVVREYFRLTKVTVARLHRVTLPPSGRLTPPSLGNFTSTAKDAF
jgi:hypothetical protein